MPPDHPVLFVLRREVRPEILPHQRRAHLVGHVVEAVGGALRHQRGAHVRVAVDRRDHRALPLLRFVPRRPELADRAVAVEEEVQHRPVREIEERLHRAERLIDELARRDHRARVVLAEPGAARARQIVDRDEARVERAAGGAHPCVDDDVNRELPEHQQRQERQRRVAAAGAPEGPPGSGATANWKWRWCRAAYDMPPATIQTATRSSGSMRRRARNVMATPTKIAAQAQTTYIVAPRSKKATRTSGRWP